MYVLNQVGCKFAQSQEQSVNSSSAQSASLYITNSKDK